MNWHRRFRSLGLTLVLLVGVSCTASEGSLTGIPETQPTEQPSPLLGGLLDDLGGVLDGVGDGVLGGPGDSDDDNGDGLGGLTDGLTGGLGDALGGAVGTVLGITDLLTCSQQKYVAVVKTIGHKGGTIKVGDHILEIPRGALSKNVKIKAEQMRGSTNSVRFSPQGLRFQKPAELTMSYKNCVLVLLPKHIVYTTEKLKILEVLRSLDLFKGRSVTAPIDHFSRYAVAY
jgi:hypothetical protein